MAASSGEVVIVPRNFKLLEELEKAEKGNTEMTVSYGLVESDDITLSNRQCTILGAPNSNLENRIISLLVFCPPEYPTVAPTVKFQTKLNYPFIVRDARTRSPQVASGAAPCPLAHARLTHAPDAHRRRGATGVSTIRMPN